MKISPPKSKVTAFTGHVPIRGRSVTYNIILEQVNTFTYLLCKIAYHRKRA
jgi:hypothetical protein